MGRVIPENLISRRVYKKNFAALVDADDGIGRSLDNCTVLFLAIPPRLFGSLAFRNVSGNTANCVNISVSIEQREFVDDTGMRSVLEEGYLLKFHAKACAKHVKIIRSIFSGLFRRKDFAIRFAFSLLLAFTNPSLHFSVHQHTPTLLT